jgi:hypothetical protein
MCLMITSAASKSLLASRAKQHTEQTMLTKDYSVLNHAHIEAADSAHPPPSSSFSSFSSAAAAAAAAASPSCPRCAVFNRRQPSNIFSSNYVRENPLQSNHLCTTLWTPGHSANEAKHQ